MTMKKRNLSIEDKHKLYESSVQNPEGDVEFIKNEFERIKGRAPHILREDFGGTGYLSCTWAKQDKENSSYVIDLDSEPVEYGKKHHYGKLPADAQERVHYVLGNVLDSYDFKADVVAAFNFSYFIFKKRKELLEYFIKVREGLNEDGLFFLDIFGGSECYEPLEEETEYDDFTYYWDLDEYDPLSHECQYYIHFKKNGIKYEKVFSYDWRMWGPREIRDILEDAGFSKTYAYWEGDDDEGGGDGEFYQTEEGEVCDSWVSYIIAEV